MKFSVCRNAPACAYGPKYRLPSSFLNRASRKRGHSSDRSTLTTRNRLSSRNEMLYRGRYSLISLPSSKTDSASLRTVCVSKLHVASSMARVFKSACASLEGRKYEPTRLRKSRALPTYITRLNRSRIKYTPGLCGTSCTFFCRSGLSFFDTATGCKGTRNLCVRHSERSAAESKNPVKLPEGSSAGSLDFARDDGVQKKNA